MTDQSPSQAAALTPEVRAKAVEKIGVRASELTFDWLCCEFEDLPNKLAEDMSVKITDSIIWALGEGSVIDDFADAAQQVTDLKAALEEAEARETQLLDAIANASAALCGTWPTVQQDTAWAVGKVEKITRACLAERERAETAEGLAEDHRTALEDLRIEYGHTKREALELAMWLHRTFYSDVVDWKPLEAASSIMTQIDNMMAGVRNRLLQAEADNAALSALQQENERLREVVTLYQASYSLIGGEGGRRSWTVSPTSLARAHDAAALQKGAPDHG